MTGKTPTPGDAVPAYRVAEPLRRVPGCGRGLATVLPLAAATLFALAGLVIAVYFAPSEETPVHSPQLPPGAEDVP